MEYYKMLSYFSNNDKSKPHCYKIYLCVEMAPEITAYFASFNKSFFYASKCIYYLTHIYTFVIYSTKLTVA
jgi:hypothetical protein